MDDRFLIIARETKTEIKVKGSRFIGESCLVSSSEKAAARLEEIRRREFSATHHCYAWLTGAPGEQAFRYSDDGEPNGTAGKPIYNVITGSGVTNVLVVVTRYFGGTKLGTGGLARAYTETARAVMDLSGVRERYVCRHYRADLDLSLYDRLQKLLHRLEARIEDTDFSDHVSVRLEIRRSRVDELVASFNELTAGKGRIEETTPD
ncbi:MAG TPA: YigZ family protein [Acidobacteriota bacterium]|nr:YigZ family protein [Acidobacteriota bacterium]